MKHSYLTIVTILGLLIIFPDTGNAATVAASGNAPVIIKEFSDGPREKTVCFLPDTQKTVPCFICFRAIHGTV
ncbi:MAG TPA: hypothetical protein VHO70_14525 [Chitinispirillaceae bacterium]|nr:hypothetical protein [Chitinispirillaceae bacterium]